MKWLAECSVAALREALMAVAPELGGYPVTVPGPDGKEDPLWHSGCVPAGDQFFVKFAWSRPAARRLAHGESRAGAGWPAGAAIRRRAADAIVVGGRGRRGGVSVLTPVTRVSPVPIEVADRGGPRDAVTGIGD